jgi:lysophospholipase L1-like esterase
MNRGGSWRRRVVATATVAACLAFAPTAAAVTASLGDSFSSGQGAGDYDFATKLIIGNGCHRSPHAWPRLLGVPKDDHFACSGAKTEDFFKPQKSGLLAGPDDSSQLSRLRTLASKQPLSRVYVTIGGNDLGFSKIIINCVIATCLSEMSTVELPRLHNMVEPKVKEALAAAKQIAGTAPVVLIGYPDLIPAAGTAMTGCGWLAPAERIRIRRLEAELDSSQAAAAAAAGAQYVSIRSALAHHELCTQDSWVNPIAHLSKLLSPEQGHPTAAGQRAIAQRVAEAAPV